MAQNTRLTVTYTYPGIFGINRTKTKVMEGQMVYHRFGPTSGFSTVDTWNFWVDGEFFRVPAENLISYSVDRTPNGNTWHEDRNKVPARKRR